MYRSNKEAESFYKPSCKVTVVNVQFPLTSWKKEDGTQLQQGSSLPTEPASPPSTPQKKADKRKPSSKTSAGNSKKNKSDAATGSKKAQSKEALSKEMVLFSSDEE